jgi:SAM-dependent methyltransferase
VSDELTTAHHKWDESWRDEHARTKWAVPESAVTELVDQLHARNVRTVLDLGCGIGRHALAFAAAGFDTTAIDASPAGIAEVKQRAATAGLVIHTHEAPFTALPVADATFDYVLAWNVLYHGDADVVRSAFGEVHRVLRPGGWFQLTMLSKRNAKFGRGTEIRPDTFVIATDDGDKSHPHFYVEGEALRDLLTDAGFRLLTLDDVDQDEPRGAFHWLVLAASTG